MEGTIGEIRLFAGNFAPVGWAFCQGQLVSISSNAALFSILGTGYGGDGVTYFALPDLRGRIPVGVGLGAGLSNVVLGQQMGEESVTLGMANLPQHSHATTQVALKCTTLPGDKSSPEGNVPAVIPGVDAYSSIPTGNMMAMGGVSGAAGGGSSHENRPPMLAMNYIICVSGIYPQMG